MNQPLVSIILPVYNAQNHLARCIGVDIRYVLYMMDKWGHADRLIKEINPQ